MDVLFETARLRLGLPGPRDVDAVIAHYRDNRPHLQPWSPTYPPGFLERDYWVEQVALRAAEQRAGRGARMFAWTAAEPARLVGNLSLTEVQRGPAQSCYLGYGLAADAQGHGFMTEAVEGAVAYAFEVLGIHRVMANHMPGNVRSAAVLARCGFAVEGYAPAYLLIDGRWEDHVLTARVNPAWSA